jgi:hypothetical protein
VTGHIGAGKTSAADYLKSAYGFFYVRYSKVLSDWLREYILALVDCKKEQGKELGPDTGLGKWVTWALQQADRIDPLVESPPSILDRKRELDGWSPYGWR